VRPAGPRDFSIELGPLPRHDEGLGRRLRAIGVRRYTNRYKTGIPATLFAAKFSKT
jgi:hypothetical protein